MRNGGTTGPMRASHERPTEDHGAPIRVMIVDDHELVREGLAELLGRQPGVEVVGTAPGGEQALAMFADRNPDVTLVDLRMTPMDGIETIGALRAMNPDARVILLTTYETDEDIYQGLRAGAASYLLKGVGLHDLVETIRAVHAGEKRIPAPIAAKLAEHMSTPELTARQLDTLRLLVAGMSNREIGQVLNVTEGTVKAHVKAILAKFGARDRAHAAAIALKRGLVRSN